MNSGPPVPGKRVLPAIIGAVLLLAGVAGVAAVGIAGGDGIEVGVGLQRCVEVASAGVEVERPGQPGDTVQ